MKRARSSPQRMPSVGNSDIARRPESLLSHDVASSRFEDNGPMCRGYPSGRIGKVSHAWSNTTRT